MLCQNPTRNELYKEITNRINAGESRGIIHREIAEFCERCQPSSSAECADLCQIWKLKKEFHDVAETSFKPELTDLLNIAKNNKRLKVLSMLAKKPYTLSELGDMLEEAHNNRSLSIINSQYIKPLIDVGFIEEEEGLYKMVPQGEKIYNMLTRSELSKLPLNFNKHDEKILEALFSGSKSYNELVQLFPKDLLNKSLNRLVRNNLVTSSILSGHIFYFKAKRRPTRKLSTTEMKIFKALPKEGITVRELSKKADVNVNSIYRYLRLLRYKRHIKKEAKDTFYNATEAGRSLSESLNIAYKLIS